MAGNRTAHVVPSDSKKSFTSATATEREHALCGAALGVRSGLPVDRNRLADLANQGDLCPDCRSALRDRGITLPMTDGGFSEVCDQCGRHVAVAGHDPDCPEGDGDD